MRQARENITKLTTVWENKYITEISKRVAAVHCNEEKVKEACDLPVKSMERRVVFLKIQNEGNFLHNSKVSSNIY